MSDMTDIKKRIAALIAKAEGTENVHEAMAFMAKANELLERYQLERHELHVDDPYGNSKSDCPSSDAWIYKVVGALARYYGAKVIWENYNATKSRKTYRIFGPESARVTHELMIDYLMAQVRFQGRNYAREHMVTPSVGTRNVGLAFSVRLNELAAQNKIKRDGLASRALVPVDINKQMIDQFYGPLSKMAHVRTGYTSTARDYADRIQINSQVSGERRKMLS